MNARGIVLAFDTLRDPRDLAEVIHLAEGFGAEVHLLGESLDPRHPKVLRKLRSWRPRLAEDPSRIEIARFPDVEAWAEAARLRGLEIIGTVLEGGEVPFEGRKLGRPAFLFGEETHGLPPRVREACDRLWTLPLGEGGRFYTVGQATALILGAWAAGHEHEG